MGPSYINKEVFVPAGGQTPALAAATVATVLASSLTKPSPLKKVVNYSPVVVANDSKTNSGPEIQGQTDQETESKTSIIIASEGVKPCCEQIPPPRQSCRNRTAKKLFGIEGGEEVANPIIVKKTSVEINATPLHDSISTSTATTNSEESNGDGDIFCVCKQRYDYEAESPKIMISCDYCPEWYHPECVEILLQSEEAAKGIIGYICPDCRTNYPEEEIPDYESLQDEIKDLKERLEKKDSIIYEEGNRAKALDDELRLVQKSKNKLTREVDRVKQSINDLRALNSQLNTQLKEAKTNENQRISTLNKSLKARDDMINTQKTKICNLEKGVKVNNDEELKEARSQLATVETLYQSTLTKLGKMEKDERSNLQKIDHAEREIEKLTEENTNLKGECDHHVELMKIAITSDDMEATELINKTTENKPVMVDKETENKPVMVDKERITGNDLIKIENKNLRKRVSALEPLSAETENEKIQLNERVAELEGELRREKEFNDCLLFQINTLKKEADLVSLRKRSHSLEHQNP